MELWRYLEKGGLRAVEVGHRRWGKDEIGLHYTATKVMQEVGNYWHMLPQYGQGRKAIWDAINPKTGKRRIDEAFPHELRTNTNKQEMKIEFKSGSIWQVVGSDTYNTIVGAPPVGLVLSEWAIANPMAWAYLAPILEENGGWALFIYTSRGNNHGKSTYDHAVATDGWFSQKTPATDTPVFTEAQLNNILLEYRRIFGQEMGQAMFDQEYLCSWEGATLGAYWAQQMRESRADNRITRVPHQEGQEVHTFWDLGIDDSMTIWFMQVIGQTFNFIDYYENTGYGIPHYAKALRGHIEGSEHRQKYIYGNHWMPHDANAREMTNNEIAISKKEFAESIGIKPVHVVQRAKNMDVIMQVHIPAVRNILGRCYFDEEKTEQGISCLENFRAEYDDIKKKLGNRYLHDWSSHGSSAFITFAVGYKDEAKIDIDSHLDQGSEF
jgi:hypothetical protein